MRHYPNYKLLNLRKFLSPKQTDKISDSFHNFFNKFVEPYEASEPTIKTSFPGPKTVLANQKIGKFIANNSTTREVINLDKSFGNYFNDIDDNTVLDMHMDNGRNALGYNYRKWVQHAKFGKYDKYLFQKPSLGLSPPVEYPKMLLELLNRIGPVNLHEVLLSNGSNTSANDSAIKIALLNKLYHLKGTDDLSKQEISEALANRTMSVLGFDGGYHGNSLSTLSAGNLSSNPNGIYTGLTSANWPVAPFPKILYPYNEHYDYNIKEEKRCVEEVQKIIKESKAPVAAMIIEPIQLLGGVRYASSNFYRDLVDLCYENNIVFICDETNTSGWANGRPFMHANWNLEKSVHMVTFGGRMQISGVFYQQDLRANKRNNLELTSMLPTSEEDPVKLIQFFHTHDMVYKVDWLDTHCSQFTETIKAELFDLQRRLHIKIDNIRGIGKIFAFDVVSRSLRDEIVLLSRNNGFKVNPIGDKTIGFTPSLMFTEIHFARFKEMMFKLNPATLNYYCPSMSC